jgi:FkbM family methyltransferase
MDACVARARLLAALGPTQGGSLRKSLRPKVLADKIRSRIEWIRFGRQVQLEPCDDLIRLGSPYGGYVVPLGLVESNWVCYSGGLGEDASFELQLIERTGCRVYGFDPAPRAATYARGLQAAEPRFQFMPVGLWSTDTTARFYVPADPDHVSHSIANLQRTDAFLIAGCRSVTSLMSELGHERIDLLKLDVEGAEYEVLTPVLSGELTVSVLCVDFHRIESLRQMAGAVRQLTVVGYSPVHVHRTDVTFVRRT